MARVFLLLALWLAGAGAVHAQDDEPAQEGVFVVRDAQARLFPSGRPASAGPVKLSHRWDAAFPGLGGSAIYTITLPPHIGREPMALLFTRIGNQALVAVNGTQVMVRGELGNPRYDAAKAPQFAVLPVALLHKDGPNEVTVQVTTQPLRWGGLSAVRYGPERLLLDAYAAQRHWRTTSALVFCVSLSLLGLMALALWARLRDPLFACFGLAAFLGIARNLDRVWPDPPVPWPLWGMLTTSAYAWHLALMFLFALLALRAPPRWLRHLVLAYLPVAMVLSVASFALGRGWLWTAALQLLAPLGTLVWLAVVNEARQRGPGRTVARALAVAGLVALVTGLYDLGVIRLGLGPPSQFSVTPHAIFIFVLVMAGIIVDRYARTAAGLTALNRTLDQRVQARETELRDAFGQLQAQQAAQATSNERQRIMRDLHDGVGAQLVALLSLIRQPQAQPDVLKEHVEAALDEMRLAVDSMQIADGDLVTALATLRYRVQPRVQAAGLTMHWEVDDLPALAAMTPTTVLQVQRILLEALTNVLKHARAKTVWVRCALQADGGALVLEVADDGGGVAASATGPGHGMQNMRLRGESIGGNVSVLPRDGGGTRVRLELAPAGAGASVNPLGVPSPS